MSNVDEIDGEDFVAHAETAAVEDGALDRDPGDEHPIVAVNPVPFPDVKAERLAGTFHYVF